MRFLNHKILWITTKAWCFGIYVSQILLRIFLYFHKIYKSFLLTMQLLNAGWPCWAVLWILISRTKVTKKQKFYTAKRVQLRRYMGLYFIYFIYTLYIYGLTLFNRICWWTDILGGYIWILGDGVLLEVKKNFTNHFFHF